jgi:hypothetical protein
MCICQRVAPDYAADLSARILDSGQNAREREKGSKVQCTCVELINIISNTIIKELSFWL